MERNPFLMTRHRGNETRRLFRLFMRLVVIVGCLWFGWFWGFTQQSGLTAGINTDTIETAQENERLEQRLVNLSAELEAERQARRRIELQLGAATGSAGDAQKRLSQIVAKHLAADMDEEQIAAALRALSTLKRCRPIEEMEVAVATGFFAGPNAVATMLDGSMRVFLEGEAGEEATRGRPWYDPEKPVSMRIAYLGGEQIHTGAMPLHAKVVAANWILRLTAEPAALQGYAKLSLEKCADG